MSTAFYVFVNVMVPLSAAFLFLLLLPFPQRARRMVNNILTKIFLIPGPLGLSTISSVLLVLGLFFAHVTYDLYDYTSKFSTEVSKHEPPKVSLSEHRLVRAQRNFWVGLLLVVFWMVLSMLLRLSKKIVEQDAELETYRAKASSSLKKAASDAAATAIGQVVEKQREQPRNVSSAPIEEEEIEEDDVEEDRKPGRAERGSRDRPGRTDRGEQYRDRERDRDIAGKRDLTQRKNISERERKDPMEEKRQRATALDREAVEGHAVAGRKKNEGY